MKTLLPALAICLGSIPGFAQTKLDKHIAVQSNQQIVMEFDFPEMVRVSTWDKAEIQIQGTVSINDGENDDAFKLESTTTGNTVNVKSTIPNLKDLPHRYTIQDGDQKVSFRSKADLDKYKAEKGVSRFNWTSNGVDMDIILEIKVPRNTVTLLKTVHGAVEVKDFSGPLTVEAKHGLIDASLTEKNVGEIIAETNFGEIFTNFDTKFGGAGKAENFHTLVSAKPGNGPRYSFESKHGNVYLRKAVP
jgi:hypothetical protein